MQSIVPPTEGMTRDIKGATMGQLAQVASHGTGQCRQRRVMEKGTGRSSYASVPLPQSTIHKIGLKF